jgi:hypothetical protein
MQNTAPANIEVRELARSKRRVFCHTCPPDVRNTGTYPHSVHDGVADFDAVGVVYTSKVAAHNAAEAHSLAHGLGLI